MLTDEEKIGLIINNMKDGQPLDNADKLFLYDFYINTEDFYLGEREKLVHEREALTDKINKLDRTRAMMFNAVLDTVAKPEKV